MLDRNYLIKESERIVELLIKKNIDYGDSFFHMMDRFGMLSFIIRITDKVGRLESIEKRQKIEVKTESVQDTIDDIIGYCLLLKHYLMKGSD